MKKLEELKLEIENSEVSYQEFVEIINSEDFEISLEEFMELMTDELAEELDINDFPILEDWIDKIETNIGNRFNSSHYIEYSCQPNQDGGLYSEQLILEDAELGILGEFMDIVTCASIRIDFRPSYSAYVEVVFINETDKKWLMGDYKYLHFEVDLDGNISDTPTLESM